MKQEDGELHETSGIHDRYFHERLKDGSAGGRGLFFLKGEAVFFLNTLRLNKKFPHVLRIWKVSVFAIDKRQPLPQEIP